MGSTKVDKKSSKADKKSKKVVEKVVEKVESESSSSSSSSSSSESSDSESEEEVVAEAKKEEESSSSSSSSESDSDSESEESAVAEESNDKKRKAEDDEVEVPAKIAKVEEEAAPAATFTVWCGGISWDAKAEDVKEYFGQCGEISDVRIRLDNATGKNKGFCHIDFTTKAAHDAALALSGSDFLGRTIRCDSAGDGSVRVARKDENYGPKSTKVFVANLNRDYDEETHRAALTEAFSAFGTLVGDIRLPYNREEGTLRGIGYLEFETAEQAEAAVKGMNAVELNGRPLRTDFSGSDDASRVGGGRGGRGGRGGFGGDRGGRGGGRGRW
ncbi:uncharacterized protein EV154DRAFT_323631 [Mucor mucedo]|uniref:uncharacterized protein n=1 Tax=Mucor mucedo TaxID=29922 RepID=UPI00221F1746|nr:uncharacterized protein EV154DRAFT_323631 [Mucor mucedo]KAI7888017.1 hypothetical protein EV154DRAFT_323631 [Mucor mucedo]